MFKRRSEAELRAELAAVEAGLAEHSWNTPEAVKAREITDQYSDQGVDRVNEELAARGLPSVAENGKMVAKGMLSYGKLERRRHKLQSKLETFSP